jgi:hypothetical protein
MSPAYQQLKKVHPLAYCALAGAYGAQTVMFAKSTGELLKATFRGDNQFHDWPPFLIVAAMLSTIFAQVK